MRNDKPLTLYNPAIHEGLLLAWFFELRKTGDLDKVAHTSLHTITSFLNFFAKDVKLGIATDRNGIWFAAWLQPYMDASIAGIWIREDKRHTPSALKAVYHFYNTAFEYVSVIVGISKQPHLKRIHEKLGYRYAGEIPQVWGGKPIQSYYLTKEAYYERKQR